MTQRIVLAGGGHAHLAVLDGWARTDPKGYERVLVTSSRFTGYSGMLPGWIAGHYRASDLLIDLAPLARRAGARLVIDEVIGLDAAARTLLLRGGEPVQYAMLSLAIGGEADLSSLACLGERVLAVRPVPRFMQAWSEFVESSEFGRPPSLAIVGGGAAGVEIALAAEAALRPRDPSITLVADESDFLHDHAPGVRGLARDELNRRGIKIAPARAAGTDAGLVLSDGSALTVDRVIAATGTKAPRWLAHSGLACSPDGFVAVGPDLRSMSHPDVFAAGDIVERTDRHLPRSGVHAVKAGPVLAANLHALVAGGSMQAYQPGPRTLYIMATGERRAIASWGRFAVRGRLPWWIKQMIDRRFVARHRPQPEAGARRQNQ